MYSVGAYGSMISDVRRIDAYAEALRRTIKPGSVVIDLGSGPGILAVIACKLGARRVYAIEPDNVVQIAREAAEENGVGPCVQVIQDYSANIKLDERADVIVSDLRGVLPYFQEHLPHVQDARDRFLAPGGRLIPARDSLFISVVEAAKQYDDLVAPWEQNSQSVSLGAGRRAALNNWSKVRFAPENLLTEPHCWHQIDYTKMFDFSVNSRTTLSIRRSAIAHGLAVWFDSELVDGVEISNAPGNPELIYGNAFFPFLQPVAVENQDIMTIGLRADMIRDGYVWTWNTRIENARREIKAEFNQSTLLASPLSTQQLRKRATNFAPLANEEGRLQQFIIAMMDGKQTTEQIASAVAVKFPDRFPSPTAALHVVTELSLKYSS